jgi:dTDP-glucose 4,6-dehydratase
MNEKIVVIGSNSFSGSSFVNFCLHQGMEVVGISRSREPIAAFLPYKWPQNDTKFPGAFKFKQLDINHNTDEIASVIKEISANYVVNFAAQSMVAQSWDYPQQWYNTNVVGNVKLHDKIRNFNFLQRYVHISTPEVYGNCSGHVDESNVFNPSTPYAASRAACDLHLHTFYKQYGFPVVYTRAANVYGSGQQIYRIIPRTILYIKLGKKLQLHGGGHSIRSFIHINDVSDATLKVARAGSLGQAYHISTDLHISIFDLVKTICKMMNKTVEEVVEISEERLGKDAAYILNSNKIRTELGWKDQMTLEEGLSETIKWVSDNFEVLSREPFNYVHKE